MKNLRKKAVFSYLVMTVVIFVISGCQTLRDDSFTPSGSGGGRDTMMSGGVAGGLYYEFSDVLIPSDMRVDKGSTFITSSPNFAAGVMSVKGRIEMNSLITYFDNNMVKDNWTQVTSFKSPRTIMLFHKDTRWCVISISERDFNTYAEIWVTPASGSGSGGVSREEPIFK